MDERQVEGFLFSNIEDAQLAQQEKRKVEYLKKHMDTSSPQNVMLVYKKAVTERFFKTPIGIDYMENLRDYLLQADYDENEIPPIPLYVSFENKLRTRTEPARKRIENNKKEKQKHGLKISILLNLVLVLLVGIMFYITVHGDNPNILNYERAITNKYATWEQELSEREKTIREKEREINEWTP